jgi:hypothetical protein
MEAVVKQSSSELIEVMQTPVAKGGNMPVDTGFLRNSLVVTIGAPYAGVRFNEGGISTNYSPQYEMALAGFEAGETIYGVYTANYAGFVHYGVNGRPGRLFVDLAAQRWPGIVASVTARLRSQS